MLAQTLVPNSPYDKQGVGKGKHSPVPELSVYGLMLAIFCFATYTLVKGSARKP